MLSPNGLPVQLTPDFAAYESMANSDSLQLLQLLHRTPDTYAAIEGSKSQDKPTSYMFIWRTHYSAEDAAGLIADVDEIDGFGETSGDFVIHRLNTRPAEYSWGTKQLPEDEEEGEEVDVSDLDLAEATHLRLNTGGPALGWNLEIDAAGHKKPPKMWVATTDIILSPWVQAVYNQTVAVKTKQVIARNIGTLSAVTTAFLDLPFGESALGHEHQL